MSVRGKEERPDGRAELPDAHETNVKEAYSLDSAGPKVIFLRLDFHQTYTTFPSPLVIIISLLVRFPHPCSRTFF